METGIYKFFKWWWTSASGMEYMTFWECSMEDLVLVALTSILSIGVVVQYLIIAKISKKQYDKYPDSRTKEYLKSKLEVFIFCASAGYGYTVLSVLVNPYKLRVIILIILMVVTHRFILSMKRNASISRIMQGELALQKGFERVMKLQLKVTDKFDKGNGINHISEDDLLSAELGVWYPVSDDVKYRKYHQDDRVIQFDTEINNGGEFGKHFHSIPETCTVIRGILRCDLTNKSAKQGESITWDSYEIHEPYAIGDTSIKVEFIRK